MVRAREADNDVDVQQERERFLECWQRPISERPRDLTCDDRNQGTIPLRGSVRQSFAKEDGDAGSVCSDGAKHGMQRDMQIPRIERGKEHENRDVDDCLVGPSDRTLGRLKWLWW